VISHDPVPLQETTAAVLEACDYLSSLASIGDLEAAYGLVLDHVVTSIPNNHVAGQIDELHTVRFERAHVVFLVSETAARPMLVTHTRIHGRNAGPPLLRLIQRSQAEVLDLLGPPDLHGKGDLVYSCGETDLVRVEIDHGSVRAVVWQPYTG